MTAEPMDATRVHELMADQLRLSRRLRAEVEELRARAHAPLAVVGMGLRLPGGLTTPESYWDFLCGDSTALSEVPADRPGMRGSYDPKPGRPGRSYVDKAGFLDDIAGFDADFFDITAREARLLDPQQRMLLETAWEALERAGLAVRRADRLDVGVYLGIMASEYSERLEDRADLTRIDPYYTTGGGLCFGAGRISYALGLRGPVASVDTACSSSLTALHLATRALRGGECRYALVCGSNLLLSANLMVSLCQTRALSPEGRSKSFLDTADGYGRGEGVGALVLMRLADAEREERPILAVVRGSAVNHDGAASSLTSPSGPAQQEVMRAALRDADVEPGEVGWIEAHGTGTVLGDPIEVGAIDGVFGAAVRERGTPLPIGSVKSRLGHLEAASGIAAAIKTVLMLQRGRIPAATLSTDGALNRHVEWDRIGLEVPRDNRPWPAGLPGRVAGINSFGMSGTNVHVVLAAHESAGAPVRPVSGRPELLTLSAKHPDALAELAASVARRLANADPAETASICHTFRVGRARFPHRLAVTGASGPELAHALAAWTASPAGPALTKVTLRARGGAQLDKAVALLADVYPDLATHLLDEVADPAELLARLIGSFGVRVDLRPADGDVPARVSWQTGECDLVGHQPETAPELLLNVLSGLFVAGADLRLDALRAPGARLLGDLPTYPFQRTRYWIEEPQAGSAAPAERPAPVAPESLDTAALSAYLLAELKEVLQSPHDLDPARSFLDAGGDSFLSTLFITKVEERFTVGLTPDDLPLDLPLTDLVGRLAANLRELPS